MRKRVEIEVLVQNRTLLLKILQTDGPIRDSVVVESVVEIQNILAYH